MASSNGFHNLLLTLHERGSTHREALISRLGKHIRPEEAVHAFNVSRLKAAQQQSDINNMDERVRVGKRTIVRKLLFYVRKMGYVAESKTGDMSITSKGLDRLISDKPHLLELPLLTDEVLVSVANSIKSKLRGNCNRRRATDGGLMDALRIIHMAARGRE